MPRKRYIVPPADRQRVFDENFSTETYNESVPPILKSISEAKSFFEIHRLLLGLENKHKIIWHDIDYVDFSVFFSFDAVLDVKKLKTEADTVFVHMCVEWNEKSGMGDIAYSSLFTDAFTHEYECDELCIFSPYTFKILKWLY